MTPEIFVKAPGRICLFGDHQDYLGLPVIACAIDRYIFLEAQRRQDDFLEIHLPDLDQVRTIDLNSTLVSTGKRDYLISSLRVLKKQGILLESGYTVSIRGDIPINAGLSSSSAVVVAWIRFLLKAFGNEDQQSSAYLARLAYEAEVLEYDSPGGLMDQYTISLGNTIFLNTVDGTHDFINKKLASLIIGESGVAKETLEVLANLRAYAQQAIKQVQEKDNSFRIEAAGIEDYQEFENYVDPQLRPYFYAALKNYTITKKAKAIFDTTVFDRSEIGALMYEHHTVLRDILKITVPLIDRMIDAAMDQGALGAKIVGSGGGGCIVALVDPDKEDQVIQAIERAGATKVYKINVAKGTTAYTTII